VIAGQFRATNDIMTDVIDISLDTILAKLRALAPDIKAEGVTRLAVFGSRVRGDARPGSDLDILIETSDRSEGARRFDLFKVMNMIEDDIGVWPIFSISFLRSKTSWRASITKRFGTNAASAISSSGIWKCAARRL
jgi:uncharacterized protein